MYKKSLCLKLLHDVLLGYFSINICCKTGHISCHHNSIACNLTCIHVHEYTHRIHEQWPYFHVQNLQINKVPIIYKISTEGSNKSGSCLFKLKYLKLLQLYYMCSLFPVIYLVTF